MEKLISSWEIIGTAIAALFAGVLGYAKLAPKKTCSIPISSKTSGALHISEEALGKINDVEEDMKLKMGLAAHELICGKRIAEMKLHISQELNDNFKTQKNDIIEAIQTLYPARRD